MHRREAPLQGHGDLHTLMGIARRFAKAVDNLVELVDCLLQPVGFGQIARERRGNQRNNQLWHKTGKTNQRPITARKQGREQIFVVTGEMRHIRHFLLEHAVFMFEPRKITRPHLDRLDLRDLGNRDHFLERVGGLGPVRILVDDDRQVSTLGHILKITNRRVGRAAKTQPVMGGH